MPGPAMHVTGPYLEGRGAFTLQMATVFKAGVGYAPERLVEAARGSVGLR